LTLQIIDAEMHKYDQWMKEIAQDNKKKTREAARTTNSINNKYKSAMQQQEQFLRGKSIER
jgi:uncharacterized protein YgiM (DUF1202 family)